ncbi:hypothetical protein DYB28_012962 [Aphanomyces astaci]|uniref:Cyclic nucleotide-binding domain-containing protein n=1 Tax=Aphanomyces astaci TaxID=112090 RepID=A0A9X8DTC1_APHAT|nr:hypothetical protein DYB28_012962 [Aphanomyces astaci]
MGQCATRVACLDHQISRLLLHAERRSPRIWKAMVNPISILSVPDPRDCAVGDENDAKKAVERLLPAYRATPRALARLVAYVGSPSSSLYDPVRWHRLKCLVRCIGQFALAANQRSAGEVTLFEPQSWHHHKLERFQHAYNKEYVVVVLHDGQVVYHQGDPIDGASGVYVVLEGIVSSYKNAAYDYSDKAYPAWHQATYPSEDVQFGTCETTATTGDTFGNRHRTFKAHEVLSRQGDPDVPLVICVAGKVLLYVQDSVEESRCRLLGPQNASAPASSGTITKKSGTNAASALTDNLEYDPGLGWCVGELGDGESFGEQAVASGGVQSATLRMVRDIAKALRRCDAGLFFQQLGQYALETMAQEAAVRVVDAGTIVLQQDHT